MFNDWAKETTTSTGAGNLTISSASGFPRISAVVGLNKMFSYGIIDDSTGAPIESGIGYLSDANTLVRSKVVETMVAGTFDNTSPTAVTLAAGTKRVICAPLARNIGPVIPFIGNGGGSLKGVGNGCVSKQMDNGSYAFEGSGRINIHPWKQVYGGEFNGFKVKVQTAQAGTILRVGLYDVGTDGMPGNLIVESASLDLSATGWVTGSFSAMVIPPGWYYIGLLTTSSSGVLEGSYATSAEAITEPCPWGMDGNNCGLGAYKTGLATTAMPNPAPTGMNFTVNVHIPGVVLSAV